MKLTSQMPSSTSLTPTAWPAKQVLRLIFLRCRHMLSVFSVEVLLNLADERNRRQGLERESAARTVLALRAR
jgi:hypothetical protein